MKKIFIAVLMAVSLVSCDNYLDVKPYGRTIPKTAEEFSALLHTHLNALDEGNSVYFIDNTSTILNYDAACGDDFETCLTGNSGRSLGIYVGNFVGGKNSQKAYQHLYETIRNCNIIIHEMKEEGTVDADKVRATAYALRGVCYYQLLRIYCEAPEKDNMPNQLGLPLVRTFDMEERPIRSTMQTTVDFIESDLLKSIEYHVNDDLYRFTESVSKGYLARLYFWTKQWDKVLPLTSELLTSYQMLNTDNYVKVMEQAFKLGPNQLIKAYRSSSENSQNYAASTTEIKYRPVSTRFLSHFNDNDKANDVRYAYYVNDQRVVTKTFFCGMRSEEFKLMQAECYYHQGKEAQALAALNELRAARIKNYEPLAMGTLPALNDKEIIKVDAMRKPLTPLMGAILSERRKELFLEGDRFFELKRNGTPEFWTVYNARKYTTLKYMYTFPIPASEIMIIDGMVQNPGYDELITE